MSAGGVVSANPDGNVTDNAANKQRNDKDLQRHECSHSGTERQAVVVACLYDTAEERRGDNKWFCNVGLATVRRRTDVRLLCPSGINLITQLPITS